MSDCSDIVNAQDKCYYSKSQCGTELNIFALYYCDFDGNPGYLALLIFILIFIFYLVGWTADKYLTATIESLTERLKCSESLAGSTLLALANETSSIPTFVISFKRKQYDLTLGGILGGGILLCTFLVGCCLLSYKEQAVFPIPEFIRNLLAFFIGLIFILSIHISKTLHLIHGIGLLLLYCIFVVIVIIQEKYSIKRRKNQPQIQTQENQGKKERKQERDKTSEEEIHDENKKEEQIQSADVEIEIVPIEKVDQENQQQNNFLSQEFQANESKQINDSDKKLQIKSSKESEGNVMKVANNIDEEEKVSNKKSLEAKSQQVEDKNKQQEKTQQKELQNIIEIQELQIPQIQIREKEKNEENEEKNIQVATQADEKENQEEKKQKEEIFVELKSVEKKTIQNEFLDAARKTAIDENLPDSAIKNERIEEEDEDEDEDEFKDVCFSIIPRKPAIKKNFELLTKYANEYKQSISDQKWYCAVIEILLAGFYLVIWITVPYFEEDSWLQFKCVLSPPIIALFFAWSYNLPIDVLFFQELMIPALILGFIFYIFTNAYRPPKFNLILQLASFLVALQWLNVGIPIILDIIQIFCIVTGIPQSIIGVTVLAWGDEINDIITDIAIAKKACVMAVFATQVGSFVNLVFGLGLGIFVASANTSVAIPYTLPTDLLVNLIVLLIFLPIVMILVAVLKGKFRRKFHSILFISVYVGFMIFVVVFIFV